VPARDPRSTFVQALAEQGAVGVALLATALALLLSAAALRLRALEPGPPRDVTAAALGAAAAWVAGAALTSAWVVPAVTLPVLVLLGAAAARPAPARAPLPLTDDASPGDSRWPALAAGAVVLALVATSALLPAWSRARADAAFRVAADPRATPEQLQAAAADARLSSKLDPPAIGPQFAAAAVAQRRGRLLEARGELLEAVREQPESAEAWARLATLAHTMADREGAHAAARRALSLDPHDPRLIALAGFAESARVPPAASPTATGTPLPDFVVR
jgi:tetratricopeptide (TPR) repeat protein